MAMVYVYLCALTLGGIVVGASMLLRGAPGQTRSELGPGTPGEAEPGAPVQGPTDPAPAPWIRSDRFWMVFLVLFGLTGLSLHTFGVTGTAGSVLAGLAVGIAAGAGADGLLRWLSGDSSSMSV